MGKMHIKPPLDFSTLKRVIKVLIFIILNFRVLLDSDFLIHPTKFQSITNIRSHFILTFISENLRRQTTSKAQRYLTGSRLKITRKATKLWTSFPCNFVSFLVINGTMSPSLLWAFQLFAALSVFCCENKGLKEPTLIQIPSAKFKIFVDN